MFRRTTVALLIVASGVFSVPAAEAVGAFGPAVTVIEAPCRHPWVGADAAGGSDGKVYGFARFHNQQCDDRIRYFEGSGDTWTSVVSPYRGEVLAVARDNSATYLLYTDGHNLRITKRVGAVFTPGRAIAGMPSGGGDLFAVGGGWWAVWREAGDVYQAKTLGQPLRRRLALDLPRDPAYDPYIEAGKRVSIAARPGGGAVLVSDCCEHDQGSSSFGTGLQVAVSADGDWVRRFTIGGDTKYEGPLVTTSGRVTWLAWLRDGESRDGQVQVTRNRTGRFEKHTFAVLGGWPSGRPGLTASNGRAFMAWQTNESPVRVQFAEEAPDGSWTGMRVSPVTGTGQRLAAIAATGGKATVLMMSPSRLYARTQQ